MKLMKFQPTSIDFNDQTKGDRTAIAKQAPEHRSVIWKLLFIGVLIKQVIAFHAFNAATIGDNLHLHHTRELNTILKTIKRYALKVTYLPYMVGIFNLETMSDPSMIEA